MKTQYQPIKMRPITDALINAQHAIEAMVVQGEEETIFDYCEEHPQLYKLYMDINNLAGEAFELYDN